MVYAPYPPPSFIIVYVHQLSSMFITPTPLVYLALTNIHKILSKSEIKVQYGIATLYIVSTNKGFVIQFEF